MPDKTVPNLSGVLDLKLRDMGDGSFALVTAPGGSVPINTYMGKVSGYVVKPVVSFARPANTDAYAPGDVIGTNPAAIFDFTDAAISPANGGMVLGATLIDKANQTTKLASPELWLFSLPPAGVADNAAFAPSDAELLTLVGVLSLATAFVGLAGAGDNGNVIFIGHDKLYIYRCAAGRTSLYGVLVARNAYTPISAEQFTVQLDLILE